MAEAEACGETCHGQAGSADQPPLMSRAGKACPSSWNLAGDTTSGAWPSSSSLCETKQHSISPAYTRGALHTHHPYSTMAFSPTTDKKKNRLSNMFGSKRESHNPNTTTTSAGAMYNDERPSNADSAYASSEGPSTSDSRGEMVHVENHNDDRNLSKNMTTGEVFDEDTGEVVTTTTTTTTTTTVVSKGGKKVQHVSVATQPHEQQSTIAEAPGDNQHLSPSTAAAHPSQRDASHSPVSHSPQAPPAYPQQQPQQQYNNPSIPHRNPNRKSREISDEQRSQYYDDGLGRYPGIPGQQQQQQQPVSPTSQYPGKGNFSYPSRSSDNLRMREDGGHGGGTGSGVGAKGTFENLKAAAVGIHVSRHSPDSHFHAPTALFAFVGAFG